MSVSDILLPNLRELTLPARDFARGVKHALGHSRRLAPVRDALPEPLRGFAREVASEIEGLAGVAREGVALLQRYTAARFGLAEIVVCPEPALRFAEAARYGLEAAVARMGRDDLMASATVAAIAYRTSASLGEPGERLPRAAARLAVALVQHHAVGPAPGTTLGLGVDETQTAMLAGFAVMLWMTIERDAAREDEAGLLVVCIDLTLSLAGEITAAWMDPDRLATLMAHYADVV